ncbi:MAG: hypothetical protein M8357_06025 [Desulfobulbaceae bacterium]|nr:hypothetical protein [Desulfobulbaceae bacterium]
MKSAMKIVLALIMATAMLYGEATGQPPPMPAEEQPEVLTRGPVNEAFAQPVNLETLAGFTAPIEPPPDIEEVPPAERPAGDHFAWVPGYWAWDTDRNGYIWVSGCWRAVPPDMYWVPGYWARASAGWQWVAGFWAPVSNTEIEYLPAPPALVIEEPPPAPSPNRIWVPPCWYWSYGQYILRPGYWIAAQVDWVWVPSHYVWTPRGYVFVSGHWDYALDRRGILFAPVYFPRHIYERRGYSYPLSIVINIDNFQFGLFSRPRYSHYYFGDYYDSSYISIGIFPWFEFEQRRTWYDPIYAHARWRHHRDEPQWDRHQRREYDRRRSDVTLRPPRTYREMERRVSSVPEPQRKNFQIVTPITDKAYLKRSAIKFEKSSPKGRAQIAEDSGKVQKFIKERRNWEAQGPGRKDNRPAREHVSPVPTKKEMTSPEKSKGLEMKPSEGKKSAPGEPKGRVAEPSSGRKGSAPPPQQQQPKRDSPREMKKEMTSPEKGKGLEMRPSEGKKSAPGEPKGRVAEPSSGRKGSAPPPPQQKSKKISPREIEQPKVDRVKVHAPPVVDKQSGASRQKGLPSRPTEEMNAPVKSKGAEKKPAKQMQSAPAGSKGQGSAPGKGGKDSSASSKQQQLKKVSPDETEQDQSDKGKEKGKGKGGGSR